MGSWRRVRDSLVHTGTSVLTGLALLPTIALAFLVALRPALALVFGLSLYTALTGAVWLVARRFWWTLGMGLALGVFMSYGFLLLFVPVLGLGMLSRKLTRSKAKLLVPPVVFLSTLYVSAALVFWVLAVMRALSDPGTGRPSAPSLLWACGVVMGPLLYFTRRDGSVGSALGLLYAFVVYAIYALCAFLGRAFEPWLYVVAATGIVVSLLAATWAAGAMASQT